ncbi:MAG: MFS transporter [Vicinamibacterales bacterium]
MVRSAPVPWYREVNARQWRALWAGFLGWTLDGFDFTILTFVLVDIQKSFTIDSALAGALGTVTLLMRLVGGVAAGTAADRWGRKLPLMLSILWFSLFSLLSGFSTSYAMLFGTRALFGIGMGGEWAAAAPLVIEHWPVHLRGIASGILQGGFSWGFILASFAFEFIYPFFADYPELGWRAMFWLGALPALFVLWVRGGVEESPVWLEHQRHRADRHRRARLPLAEILRPPLLGITIQTSLLMSGFMCSYYAMTYWYATHLRESGLAPFWYVIALNLGGVGGSILWGRLSETRLGRRGAVTCAALLGAAVVPLYLMTTVSSWRLLGACLMGLNTAGMWGVVPTYLTERFPTAVRGAGPGCAYHVGAGFGSITPFVIGWLYDGGMVRSDAMALCITGAALLVATLMWTGPETRGRTFDARA